MNGILIGRLRLWSENRNLTGECTYEKINILASASPRRQELLHLIMDDFGIAVPDVDSAIEDSNRHLGVKNYRFWR